LGVAENRVAVVRKLHAELVGPARLRPQFQPRQSAVLAFALEVKQGLTRSRLAWVDDFDAAGISVLAQPILHAPGSSAYASSAHGPLEFLYRPLSDLPRQPWCCLARPREQENAGSRLIQAMDHAQKGVAGLGVFFLQVAFHNPVERFHFALKVRTDAS